MIAALRGTIDSLGADHAVIDVGGVGYLVFCSRRTLDALGRAGQPARLAVETVVREDRIELFGFPDPRGRDWFRLLVSVQGVGPRMALAIQGVLDADALAQAIAAGDRAALTRADGVGPKLAQRILGELKDKAGTLAAPLAGPRAGMPSGAPAGDPAGTERPADTAAVEDAVSALVNLGYGRSEAFAAVAGAARALPPPATAERLIPAALKALAP
jgi:Holliday junction DNA helicase RuvA